MATESMIERVGEAIAALYERGLDGICSPEGKRAFGRAAIEAMREPTEAMLKSVEGRYYGEDSYLTMIDVALET